MQYFGDDDEAAPQLNRVRLSPDEAQRSFDHLLRDIETTLACHLVHGDLSPHNVLYWQDTSVIIDFPQAVDPRFNSRARDLFLRDIDNICRYFGKQDESWAIANDLWTRYELGEL
jgi:RIO kinase 1